MIATTMDALPTSDATRLGTFLRERRARLDPAALGFAIGRRRTPGLRREEVAARAHISPTWYTWLEQGRGGAPSAEALERVTRALMLTEIEREHVFLLALGRPPEPHYRSPDGVTPRLQRILTMLDPAPAMLRTATWEVIAWNAAATVIFPDYGAVAPRDRNILRMIFLDPRSRAAQHDWRAVARFVVGSFRVDAARAGAMADIEPLVDELCARSPEFAAMWRDPELQGPVDYVKHLRHPTLGEFAFELSTFAVDGRSDLSLVVYNPASPDDAARIREALSARPTAATSAAGASAMERPTAQPAGLVPRS